MKQFGNKESNTAAVLCGELRCVKNNVLHIQDVVSAELEAKSHEGVKGHEAVIVYTDYAHPINHDDAVRLEELTGVPHLDELTTL